MTRNKLDLDTIINKYHKVLLVGILLLSFVLNTSYVSWGLPGYWHPDEAIEQTINMFNHWTLNPDFFTYPNLHIYLLLFSVIVPLFALEQILEVLHTYPSISNLVPDFHLTKPVSLVIVNHINLIYALARVLSAIMGAATVLLVYLIATKIFNKKVGLLSATFLAITAGFVNLAHFSTVDIPLTFWCTLSFYLLLLAFEKGTSSMYALAGVSVGLTTSTKYPGALMAVPLIVVFILATKKPGGNFFRNYILNKNLLVIGVTSLGGFFIGTPFALINFRDFLAAFLADLFIHSSVSGVGQLGFIPHIYNLFNIYGVFIAFIALLGFFYFMFLLYVHKNYKVLILIIAISSVYLFMGSMMFYPVRYIMPLVPLLTIGSGKLIYDLQKSITLKFGKIMFMIFFVLGITYTGTYTISGILQMKNDDRNLAREWILQNVHETAYIEGTPYGINIPKGYNNFIPIPIYHRKETGERMRSNDFYKKITEVMKLSGEAEESTFSSIDPEPEEVSLEFLLRRKPDYLVLSERWYGRFFNEKANAESYFPLQHHLYESLFDGQTPYKIMADFRKEGNIFTPKWEFVNAGVTIFKYVDEE